MIARVGFPEHDPKDDEHENALDARFVKLARVARFGAGTGENNAPRQIGRAAPQFAVHEIREASKEQSKGRRYRHIIANAEQVQTVLLREVPQADHDTEEATVERHTAFPKLQHRHGIAEHLGLVKEDVTEPPAQDDAERRIENEIIGMAFGHRRARLSKQAQQIPPMNEDARNIGQTIPAQLEKAEIERDRRQV